MGYRTRPETDSKDRSRRDLLQDYLDDVADMSVLDSEEQLRQNEMARFIAAEVGCL